MNNLRKISLFVLMTAAIIVIIGVTACQKYVVSIRLDQASISISRGECHNLTANVEPANASNKAVIWTSNDESIAIVNKNGIVTGLGVGTAAITVTTADGGFTDTCTVTVADFKTVTYTQLDTWLASSNASATEVNYIEVTGISATSDLNGDTTTTPYEAGALGKKIQTGGKKVYLKPVLKDGDPLEVIPQAAFYNVNNLAGIEFPDTLTTISVYAFEKCASLSSLTFPDSLESIGNHSFRECTSLTSIDFSGCTGLQEIWHAAFSNCSSLIQVNISGCTNLTNIRPHVFRECTNLSSVDLPNSIIQIWTNSFYYCQNLSSVDLSVCTGLTDIPLYTFTGCIEANILLPSGITNIAQHTFGYNDSTYCQNVTVPTQAVKDLVTASGYPESRIIGP